MTRKEALLQILSMTGGLLSALAWFPSCNGLILLVLFIPLFLITRTQIDEKNRYGERLMFIKLLPGFAMFNIVSIAWIRIAGIPLLITAITANTFLMTFTFWLAWLVKRRAGPVTGNAAFIVFWLTMEYLTNHVSWFSPWLNLGNGLAKNSSLIQWYEFTGAAGGTLWILITNMVLASLIASIKPANIIRKITVIAATAIPLILIPPALSLHIGRRVTESSSSPIEVAVIQPNIDPYSEKFDSPTADQIQKILTLAESTITSLTRWIVIPETTIAETIILNGADTNRHIASITAFLQNHPDALFIAGAVTSSGENSLHNSAILISAGGAGDIYHKSKLVPGIEGSLTGIISVLQYLFPDLGGTAGGYTGQKTPTLLHAPDGSAAAAPVICFESAFGGYVAQFVRQGASFLAIITNDGWWKGTMGYYQHLNFSRLRAIENRRPVVRTANTGVSAIIDIKGNITESVSWYTEGTILSTITPGNRLTFYTRNGDLIMRIALAVSLFILTIHMVAIPLRKKINLKKNHRNMQPL
jgi:apolipoprotein N-acyltransferase